MIPIVVQSDNQSLLDYINNVAGKLDDPSSLMADIGEYGIESTKLRFDTSIGPDGEKWAPNSEVTILQYLNLYSGSYTKIKRKLSSKGADRVMSKKPLVGETRTLSSTIFYESGRDFVEWGSPQVQSAMMQFGGTKEEFPWLWGDIPAREYLGIDAQDELEIQQIVDYLLA